MSDVLSDPTAHLCHYTTVESAFEFILPRRALKMNPYSAMRDPYESKRLHLRSAAGYRGGDEDDFLKHVGELDAEIAQARDDYCLLSLTRGDDELAGTSKARYGCGWARPRMWEQYADKHAGACLVFDRHQLVTAITATEIGSEIRHQAVKYSPAGFADTRGAHVTIDGDDKTAAEQVAEHVRRNEEAVFFHKTDDWASEFEYRFVWRRQPDAVLKLPPVQHVPFGDSLKYVILGERAPKWIVHSARLATEERGAVLRQIEWLDRPVLKPPDSDPAKRPRARSGG